MSASDQAYPAGPPRPGTTGGRPAGPAGGGGIRPGQTPQRPAGSPQRPMTVPSRPAPAASPTGSPAGAAPRTASPAPGVRPATGPTGAGRPPITGAPAGRGPVGPGPTRPVDGPAGPTGAGQSPQAARPAASSTVAKSSRPLQPRIVRLTLAKIDPWSALKLSFLLAVGIGIATVVAAFVVWNVVDKMGVFDKINSIVVDNFSAKDKPSTFDLYDYVGMGRVVSLATVIAVFNVLLLTALGTLMSALYNVSSSLVGGLKVTLSDE